jgi:hypothetical protein
VDRHFAKDNTTSIKVIVLPKKCHSSTTGPRAAIEVALELSRTVHSIQDHAGREDRLDVEPYYNEHKGHCNTTSIKVIVSHNTTSIKVIVSPIKRHSSTTGPKRA